MKWTWKIGRLAGIDVYVHATFFILIAWIGLSYWEVGQSVLAVVTGVGFILALFGCVVLHELGHALMARRYGIRTKHITLLPIGGVALLERMPDDPKQEVKVALAGPAVNLVIALALWLWLSLANATVPIDQLDLTAGPFLERLMVINAFLAVFNLLPAFPMDGGRVLRALLAMRMERSQATQIAASVGQGLALMLGLLGLLYNPFLIFIALFVWIGAAAEAGVERIKSVLSGVAVGRAMMTEYQPLSPDDPLTRAVELTLAGSQKDFPVQADGTIIGVLSQVDQLKGLQEKGQEARVGDAMQSESQSSDIGESLEQVLTRLQDSACRLLSVTDAGLPVGIVNLDNVIELVNIQTALLSESSPGSSKKR